MTYLYGDSSASPLQSNFIQFLGDALDFSVHALLSAGRMQRHADRIAALEAAAEEEDARLESLGQAVSAAVAASEKGGPQSKTAACGAALLASTAEIVRKHAADVAAVLAADVAAIEASDALERQGCLAALETLLRQHDPPGTTVSLHFTQDGARYSARRIAETTFGLRWTLDIEIPTAHPLNQVTRLDKFLPQIEIQAPESGGWLRKEIKNRPQRLEKYYLSELRVTPTTTTMRLRAHAEGEGPGFDVEVGAEEPRVRAVRIGEQATEAPAAFEISEEDAAKILALHEKVVASAASAASVRTRLVEANVDGAALVDLPDPTDLVDRLITAMTPVVRDIAQHSLAPTELVLKRLLGDNRREEIFVSKASLSEKLSPLTSALQGKFGGLGLSAPSKPPPMPAEDPFDLPKVIVGPSLVKASEGRSDSSPSLEIAR